MVLADSIRAFVLREYIQPARATGITSLRLRACDIHTAMHLENRMPAVCGALDAEKFLDQARLVLERREGPKFGATVEWTYGIKR